MFLSPLHPSLLPETGPVPQDPSQGWYYLLWVNRHTNRGSPGQGGRCHSRRHVHNKLGPEHTQRSHTLAVAHPGHGGVQQRAQGAGPVPASDSLPGAMPTSLQREEELPGRQGDTGASGRKRMCKGRRPGVSWDQSAVLCGRAEGLSGGSEAETRDSEGLGVSWGRRRCWRTLSRSMMQSYAYIWESSCGHRAGAGPRWEREAGSRQRAGDTFPQGERGAWRHTPHHSPAKKKVSLKKKKTVAKSTYPLKSQVRDVSS